MAERFEELIGFKTKFEDDPPHYPEYVIGVSTNEAICLIDLTKKNDFEWKEFSYKRTKFNGIIMHDKRGYSYYYVKKAIDILKPDGYAVHEVNGSQVLLFKKGDFGIMIPQVKKVEFADSILQLSKLNKTKITKAMVL